MLASLLGAMLLAMPVLPPAAPPTIVKSLPVREKLVAFSFDDGPNRSVTPKVLALLQKHGAHATFFVIGQEARANPDILRSLSQAGMEIGNHGMHHRLLRGCSADARQREVQDGALAIVQGGVPQPNLYRFPTGESDLASRQYLSSAGYTLVGWDIDPRDSIRGTTEEQIVRTVLQQIHPGAIVLLHDGPPVRREPTLRALSRVLPALQADGYRIVSVGQLLRASAGETA